MKIPYVIDNQTHKIADIRHVTSLRATGKNLNESH